MSDRRHMAQAERSFEENISNHEMEVIRDDGEYRHLRFREPGTPFYGFDLITWPGWLMSVGDVADGYAFSGLHGINRMKFFAGEGGFDPSYWSTKVRSSRWPVKRYSEEILKEKVAEDLGHDEKLLEAWNSHASGYELGSKDLAITAAMEFVVDDERRLPEFYEHDLEEFDFHFLLACLCIKFGARTYLDSKTQQAEGPSPYERIRDLRLDPDAPLGNNFKYEWNEVGDGGGYEEFEEGHLHYSGVFHPGEGLCEGNPCSFCGRVSHSEAEPA